MRELRQSLFHAFTSVFGLFGLDLENMIWLLNQFPAYVSGLLPRNVASQYKDGRIGGNNARLTFDYLPLD